MYASYTPEQRAAFDRCIDVMSNMLLKYGPKYLSKNENNQSEKQTVEDSNNSSDSVA